MPAAVLLRVDNLIAAGACLDLHALHGNLGVGELDVGLPSAQGEQLADSITNERAKAEALNGIAQTLAATDPDRALA